MLGTLQQDQSIRRLTVRLTSGPKSTHAMPLSMRLLVSPHIFQCSRTHITCRFRLWIGPTLQSDDIVKLYREFTGMTHACV